MTIDNSSLSFPLSCPHDISDERFCDTHCTPTHSVTHSLSQHVFMDQPCRAASRKILIQESIQSFAATNEQVHMCPHPINHSCCRTLTLTHSKDSISNLHNPGLMQQGNSICCGQHGLYILWDKCLTTGRIKHVINSTGFHEPFTSYSYAWIIRWDKLLTVGRIEQATHKSHRSEPATINSWTYTKFIDSHSEMSRFSHALRNSDMMNLNPQMSAQQMLHMRIPLTAPNTDKLQKLLTINSWTHFHIFTPTDIPLLHCHLWPPSALLWLTFLVLDLGLVSKLHLFIVFLLLAIAKHAIHHPDDLMTF